MKIVIVDYGMGNIPSIVSAVKHVGYNDIHVSDSLEDLESANKIILPGVGNFSNAIKIIRLKSLAEILSHLVMVKKKPILGICLGMQLLGKSSSEGGFNEGLGFVDATVDGFSVGDLKVPHVGYNQVATNQKSRLYKGVKSEPDYYFTHSFCMKSDADIGQSMCNYGGDFIASFEFENIAGTQFHPELSQKNGLNLLKNFLEKF